MVITLKKTIERKYRYIKSYTEKVYRNGSYTKIKNQQKVIQCYYNK